jgi:RHS repeat-associated protein
VYDLDGNMMYDGTWGYAWDGENRLVGLSPAVTNAGAKRLGFGYDFMSRRVWKAVEVWDGTSWSTTVTVTYAYDDWNLVAERRSNESFTRFYVWGLDLSGTLQGAGGIGGLLAGLKTDLPADLTYYHADANGNITTLLATNGIPLASYVYDPFGNPITATGPLADDNPFRFSSKYTDGESGLVYYGYRFYSSEMGRWQSKDPIDEAGGLNLYVFVINNPFSHFDYLGALVKTCSTKVCSHLKKFTDNRAIGRIVCEDGEPCTCSWPENLANWPPEHNPDGVTGSAAVAECNKVHEDVHANDPHYKCPPCDGIEGYSVQQLADESKPRTIWEDECPAYRAAKKCLDDVSPSNRDDSYDIYNKAVENNVALCENMGL